MLSLRSTVRKPWMKLYAVNCFAAAVGKYRDNSLLCWKLEFTYIAFSTYSWLLFSLWLSHMLVTNWWVLELFNKQFLFFTRCHYFKYACFWLTRLGNNTTQLRGMLSDCILSLWFIANRWPTYIRNILRSPLSSEMEAVHVFIKRKRGKIW